MKRLDSIVALCAVFALLIMGIAFSPSHGQTISGCGTTTIAKASMSSTAKLTSEVACFGKARDAASSAVSARTARLAQIVPIVKPPVVETGAASFTVGMNLAGLGNNSTELPWIDYLKLGGDPTQGQLSIPLALGPIDLVMTYEGGTAVSVYDAKAATSNAIGWNNMQATGFAPGRVTFHSEPGGSVNLSLAHIDPANPIRNIHLFRASDEAAFKAGEIINPDFAAFIKSFSPLRTMDWSCINGSGLTSWSQRPKLSDAVWGCAPIEAQVAVANKVGSDLWLNIPALADDDYIRQAVTLVRDGLAPARKLHLEYSNEVWNTSFDQSKQAQARADKLWGNGATVPWGNEMYAGYRSAQMAAIARDVFGADADKRLAVVYATFPHWTGPEVDAAYDNGVALAGKGTVRQLFRERSTTTYFGAEFGIPGGYVEDQQKVLSWVLDPTPAGLNNAFQQLEHGNLLKSSDSLDWLASVYPIEAARAKAQGLTLVAYEGGLHISFFGTDHPVEFTAFVQRMIDDPRMGMMYARLTSDFRRLGGTTLTHFNDVGPIGLFGTWGAARDLKSTSPRLEVLRAESGR